MRLIETFRDLLSPDRGLREIDPEKSVPWTPIEWLLFVLAVIGVAVLLWWSIRRLETWLVTRSEPLTKALREFDRLDERHLRRRVSHEQALTESAEILREALRTFDRVALGRDGAHRTTDRWQSWSKQYLIERADDVDSVFRDSDRIKFSGADVGLNQVRRVKRATRRTLVTLADRPSGGSKENVDR